MNYLGFSIVFLATGCYSKLAVSSHVQYRYPEDGYDLSEDYYENAFHNLNSNDIRDADLENAMNILRKILILPWPNGESPILYVENRIPEEKHVEGPTKDGTAQTSPQMPVKRMRYYRKYPWKRQNVKYDPDSRFVCSPTKNEVHQLLVALHRSRFGDKDLSVDFCNRKRPAHFVFTNIHYLGK